MSLESSYYVLLQMRLLIRNEERRLIAQLDPKRRFRGNHLSHREAGNDGFGAGQGVVDIDPEDKKR